MSYLPPMLDPDEYWDTFRAEHTGVFWDVNSFPLPDIHPHLIYENIKLTLSSKGYTGPVSIWLYAYSESRIRNKEDYELAGFRFCFEPYDTRDYRMTVDMLLCALDHPSSNLIVIARNFIDEDAVFNIHLLHNRRLNIFLAYDQVVEPIIPTQNPLWLLESLWQASLQPSLDQQQGGEHVVDKKLNTTIRIINTPPMPTTVVDLDRTTHAIWNAVDSAALEDLDPVISAANIDAFFMLKGLPPPDFTKVFADEDALPEHLISKYLGSTLLLDIVPKGNTRVRNQRIATFILFHALSYLCDPTTLLVLSEDVLEEDPLLKTVYESLRLKGFTLIFEPPKSILASELHLHPSLRRWF
ncbi:unnamed protein product [Eruca vesicaria subsp. sativa]|uniref:NYN domain-containing protein n=1 Tax=Eruca vesicaria subsp. sativa TaxID=29727 RepID=A0ABC8LXY3_ERUVS|nr:unnamed protein product [Eruca vesicaria subsp. sativa]